MRRSAPTSVVLFTLGSCLLLGLLLPLLNLFTHTNWTAWATALSDPRAAGALRTSIVTSLTSLAIMTVFGVPLGYMLSRTRTPLRHILVGVAVLSMVIPGLSGGILLLQTFGPNGTIGGVLADGGISIIGSRAGIVLAQCYVASPFVVVTSMIAFIGIDRKLEAAAATLGDSPWHVFRRVSLPLAWPTVAAGLVLAWMRALGEFGATMIVAYTPHTLPVHLWVRFEAQGLRGALPVAFLLVVVAALTVAVWTTLGRLRVNGETVEIPSAWDPRP